MILTEKDLPDAYKRLEEIDTKLKHEYDKNGKKTCYASQLEYEYGRIEVAICECEEELSKLIK